MGWKINIDPTGRDFIFNPAGDNTRIGSGLEQAVADPQTAIDRANALAIPPSPFNPASINASVTGAYSVGITIPESVIAECRFASIITSDAVNTALGGSHASQWGALINLRSSAGKCIEIDGVNRVRAITNTMVVGSDAFAADDGIGVDISGSCDDIFIQNVSCELRGERAVLFSHTATTPTPIEYTVGVVNFFNVDQVFMKFDPPNATDQAIVNLSSAQESAAATKSTTNSMLFQAMNGDLIVDAEIIQAQYIAIVEPGARFALDAIIAVGNLVVEDGGTAIIRASLWVGDIEVQGTGKLDIEVQVFDGTITPSDPGDGGIEGIVESRRFGDRRVLDEILLKGVDTTQQDPTGTGVAMQVSFGAGGGDLAADGTYTAPKNNQYFFRFELELGRVGLGGVAIIFFRLLVDGVVENETASFRLDVANDMYQVVFDPDALELSAGQEVTLEMLRSINGMNDGSLIPEAPSQAGWADSPSAILTVTRRS